MCSHQQKTTTIQLEIKDKITVRVITMKERELTRQAVKESKVSGCIRETIQNTTENKIEIYKTAVRKNSNICSRIKTRRIQKKIVI